MDQPTGDWTEVEGRRCPWCSSPATEGDTHCKACGASLAQRETLDGLSIPGVTAVDPALADAGAHDTLEGVMRVERSMTQAGIFAVHDRHRGFVDLLVDRADLPPEARRPFTVTLPLGPFEAPDVSDVGEPSEAALEVAERLDANENGTTAHGPADPDRRSGQHTGGRDTSGLLEEGSR